MDSPIVSVSNGSLRGCLGENSNGEEIYKFLGIPYAKPPIGPLRFKDPVPSENWAGVKECTKEGDACYHLDERRRTAEGSEDCLYLNVYTKKLPNDVNELKPVMVWIHGGAFLTGSGDAKIYGPEFLLNEDIVLVTLNYRLGILGFLQLQDDSLGVFGNAGLKDQSLAIKWVKENIAKFNGDPNNITIFGESAGSVSVHYQVLSSMSSGIFHKAILQSGTALNHWAVCKHDAVKVAKIDDQHVENETQALEVLRHLPLEKLNHIQREYEKHTEFVGVKPWGPVIENPTHEAFISQNPIDIIKSGNYNKVPMIIGYNDREGMMFEPHRKLDPNPSLDKGIPLCLEIDRDTEQFKNLVKKIEDVYCKGIDRDEAIRLLMTDSAFLVGIIASVKQHLVTSYSPIYFYRVTIDTSLNLFKKVLGVSHLKGVCHGDDIGYLFKSRFTPPILSGSLEDVSVKRFVKLWTNFAKYGNPTKDSDLLDNISWEKVTSNDIHFLDIGSDLVAHKNPEPERLSYWKEVYELSPSYRQYL